MRRDVLELMRRDLAPDCGSKNKPDFQRTDADDADVGLLLLLHNMADCVAEQEVSR